MGRASALLKTPRGAALVALLAVLTVYYAVAASLPHMTLWWEIVFLGVVLIPAIFDHLARAPALAGPGLGLAGAAFGVLAVLCEVAGLDILADFSKLAALTLISFWFLGFFETVLWVALAAIIPAVDAFSVFRGPTGHIVEERPSIFETIAFGFPFQGDGTSRPTGKASPQGDWLQRVQSFDGRETSTRSAERRRRARGHELWPRRCADGREAAVRRREHRDGWAPGSQRTGPGSAAG